MSFTGSNKKKKTDRQTELALHSAVIRLTAEVVMQLFMASNMFVLPSVFFPKEYVAKKNMDHKNHF